MLFKWLQSELPWTPETLHCSHFCDFDASLLSLFSFFFEVRKNIDFGALWAGAGGGGRGSSKLQFCRFCKKCSARPAPLKGCGEYIEGFPPAAGPCLSAAG